MPRASSTGTASRARGAEGSPAVVALAVVAAGLLVLPLLGLLIRAPWSDVGRHLLAAEVRTALRLSLVCSAAAVVASLAVGLPMAWLLARYRFAGRSLLRALVTLPMILPPVVGGVALLTAFGRRGIVGRWLDSAFGLTLPFTTLGAVVAETFVAMPFFVITVEAALRSMDRRYEEASATLGARPWTTFRRVTLPLIAPSIGAGAALTWARALGEFGATITFAGNFEGRTQTMPLAVYVALETDPGSAIILSLILLSVSLGILVGLRDRWLGGA